MGVVWVFCRRRADVQLCERKDELIGVLVVALLCWPSCILKVVVLHRAGH